MFQQLVQVMLHGARLFRSFAISERINQQRIDRIGFDVIAIDQVLKAGEDTFLYIIAGG